MLNWRRPFEGRRRASAPEIKDSRVGPLIALTAGGRARWTPRDYAHLAEEGFAKNAVAYRCVRMIAEAAASTRLPPQHARCRSSDRTARPRPVRRRSSRRRIPPSSSTPDSAGRPTRPRRRETYADTTPHAAMTVRSEPELGGQGEVGRSMRIERSRWAGGGSPRSASRRPRSR